MSPYNFFTNKTIKALSAIGLLLTGTIHAEYDTCSSLQCDVSSLQIGASYTRANIKIEDQSSFRGNLGGLQGSYEYRPWNGLYGSLKASWKQGKTRNSFADRKLTYVDVQERIGYTYASCCNDWSLLYFQGSAIVILVTSSNNQKSLRSNFSITNSMFPLDFYQNIFSVPAGHLALISPGCLKCIQQLRLPL